MHSLWIELILVYLTIWSQYIRGEDAFGKLLAKYIDTNEDVCKGELVLKEFDMIIDKNNRQERYRGITENDLTKRWQTNIPFEISNGIGALQELAIRRAIPEWERYTCLNFYDNKQEYNRIVFKHGDFDICASEVGMTQGPQIIYLGKHCFEPVIILHEIGHALGFYHEHNRWDRDKYIEIHHENIQSGHKDSFIKHAPEDADYNSDYDYMSIMHYGQYFFSKNRSANLITIKTIDPEFQDKIGTAKHPSFHDYKTVNAMYKCADFCAKVECPDNGFLGKNCRCYCKGKSEDKPVRLCFQKEECPKPFVNEYLFEVKSKDKTTSVNMTRSSFPDGTELYLLSTNWNCTESTSKMKCKSGKWKEKMKECPVELDIKMSDEADGVIEVILNDWYRGYICDDEWDDNDATVACKMLGYARGLAYFSNSTEVNESLPILLDNVQCSGEEHSLSACKHNGWGKHNCKYSEVVSVKCFDDALSNVINKTTNIDCGETQISNAKRTKRHLKVTGGNEAQIGMFPWQVGIQRNRSGWIHWCGGTIINNEWIMSAAHCFDDLKDSKLHIKDIRVIVGEHDLTKQEGNEKTFDIEYIVKHWNYSVSSRKYPNNDIALLKIISFDGIEFDDYIQPACLPEEFTKLSSETKCEVSGWGKDRESGELTDILKGAEVSIVPETNCKKIYTRYPFNFAKVICAGGDSADTCQGDSGGPLVCKINGKNTVLGITSWGRGCGSKDYPGVYTNVLEYTKWINEQIYNHHSGGCTLSDDRRYEYFTMEGLAKNPGDYIPVGETLIIQCRFADYNSYDDDYLGYDYYGLNEEKNIISCESNNKTTEVQIECPAGSCKRPDGQNMAELNTQRSFFDAGETVTNFICDIGYFLSSDKGTTCRSDGSWSNEIRCLKGMYYLIRAKIGNLLFAGTNEKVYISLFGAGGITKKINFIGSFKTGDVNEIRVFARDIRPIEKVQIEIGQEGRLFYDALYLDYISIYVEDTEDFYVFRNNGNQWTERDNSVTIYREGCVNSFIERPNLYPSLRSNQVFLLGQLPRMSLRGCKQTCIADEQSRCNGVYFNKRHNFCYGFTNDMHFLRLRYTLERVVYFRTCKNIEE